MILERSLRGMSTINQGKPNEEDKENDHIDSRQAYLDMLPL